MTILYQQINYSSYTFCRPGETNEICFDSDMQLVPYEDMDAFTLQFCLELDGHVTMRQTETSTSKGLLLVTPGFDAGSPFEIKIAEEISLTRLLGVNGGKIYHPACEPCLIFAWHDYLDLGAVLEIDWIERQVPLEKAMPDVLGDFLEKRKRLSGGH
jgi:hypothetical protein